ncbi:MAG: glycine zipper 2TM domain-containing protein [Rhodocyclaceae bacterium]|nr:glycine zipper 2TM domain-containing protein [Rhodocyclaceae bacterium]
MYVDLMRKTKGGTWLAWEWPRQSNPKQTENMQTASRLERPSPLMNIAAVAIIVASLTAVGAITGLIPAAHSQKNPEAAQTREAGDGDKPSVAQAGRNRPTQLVAVCPQCGVIESIQAVEVKGQGSGVGAVAGGVAGAVVGSQFGHGNGRTALGVLGAAGGAYAGHEIEKNLKKSTRWRVAVRMEDGTARTLSQAVQPAFAVGDKVKVINGALMSRS